jgi:folate-dependent phosphoribosylglycinamide formyltransferase PurN
MPKCVILTTDTKHHRFFVNYVAQNAETTVILEERTLPYRKLFHRWRREHSFPGALINNPYWHLPYRRFSRQEDAFEDRFIEQVPYEWTNIRDKHWFHDVNDVDCVQLVSSLHPDIVISFGTLILKKDILSINALMLNIHRGIVPAYRGLDSDLWAMYFRDFGNIGTTVHVLAPYLDTGDIVRQRHLELTSTMKPWQMRYYTTILAAEMVKSIINEFAANDGKARRMPQNLAQSNYYSFIPPLKRMLALRQFRRYVNQLSQR